MAEKLVVALVREPYFGGAALGSWVAWYGYDYRRATSDRELLTLLRSSKPALVVVNLELWPRDPSEIVREAGTARLVGYAPYPDAERRREAEAAGFDEVLVNIAYHRTVRDLLPRYLPDATPPPEDEQPPERAPEGKRHWGLWRRR